MYVVTSKHDKIVYCLFSCPHRIFAVAQKQGVERYLRMKIVDAHEIKMFLY